MDRADATPPAARGADGPAPAAPPPAPPSPPPSEAASASSSVSPHYDNTRDIVCKMEFLGDRALKNIILGVYAAILLGVALLVAALVLKVEKPDQYVFQNDNLPTTNTVIASLQIVALLAFTIYFTRRLVRSTLSGKRWSRRRLKGVELSCMELALNLSAAALFLASNANVFINDCAWFSPLTVWLGFASWTVWNSLFLLYIVQAGNMMPICQGAPRGRVCAGKRLGLDRPDAIMMDAPWWFHWPKLSIWLVMEGILLGIALVFVRNPPPQPAPLPGQSCHDLGYECTMPTAALVLLNLVAALTVGYFIIYIYYIRRAFRSLYARPYNRYRMANQLVRLHVRLRGLTFGFFTATIVVYTYVGFNTCSSFIYSWLGYTPMQVVATAVALAQSYLTVPSRPGKRRVLHVWLQEFAWTERDEPRKRAERSSSLPAESYEGFCMDCEPIFTFSVAIKLMYWSYWVYEHEEQQASPFTPATALDLFVLQHFDMVWERETDAKALVGWSEGVRGGAAVVIAFRGTASLKNALADLQAWRTRYPPGIGSPLLWTAPMVHRGFMHAYTYNGFNERLLAKVEHIVNRCQSAQLEAGGAAEVQVYLTGHSLGGALAKLCAFDIATRSPCAGGLTNIKCYTFGAPRLGNHVFAKMFNQRVPDTWQIINADDAVTRAGKFLCLYKHVGNRVLVNVRGDLIVRPSYVEYALRRTPGGSVTEHYLTMYQRAMAAVVTAQFGSKSLGGTDGVLMLASDERSRAALSSAGINPDSLEHLGSQDLAGALASKSASAEGELEGEGTDHPSGLAPPGRHGWGLGALLSRARRGGKRAMEPVVLAAGVVERQAAAAPAAPAEGPDLADRQQVAINLLQCQTVCQLMRARRGGGVGAAPTPMGDAEPRVEAAPRQGGTEGVDDAGMVV